MRTPRSLTADLARAGFDIDALARALGFRPTMMAIQAPFFGGQKGARFVDTRTEACDGPRLAYYAMNEDGLALRVIPGQMGLDTWGDDDESPTRTLRFSLPRTFD